MCIKRCTPMAGEIIRKMLQLRHQNLNQSRIAKSINVKPSTVSRWFTKADALEVDCEKAQTLTDQALEDVFNSKPGPKTTSSYPVDLDRIDFELEAGKTVEECYSDYVEEALKESPVLKPLKRAAYFMRVKRHREALKARSRAMMMLWDPGDYMQIDMAGDPVELMYGEDGQRVYVKIFVACLPATGMIFAWALPARTTIDWNEGIVKAFKYFGRRPTYILCDNDPALVVVATPGCQKFTKEFEDLAKKYGFEIECARPGMPRDKGAVELAVGRITRKVIKKIKARTLKTIADVQLRLESAFEEMNSSPATRTGIIPWDDFRTREFKEMTKLPDIEWTRLGAKYHRTVDAAGGVGFQGHTYLCKPDYDIKKIDVVEGRGGKLYFMRPGTDVPLWDYPHYQKGESHPTEGTKHAKQEFRAAHELTVPMRLLKAKDRLSSLGKTAAKFAAAFVKANEHKSGSMTAQKLDWIYNKLKDEDQVVAEHAFMHALEIGNLNKEHLMVYISSIKQLLAKTGGPVKAKKGPATGACLHSTDSLVPPAPQAC